MPGDDLGACIEAVVDVMGNYIREPLIIPRGDTRPDFDMVVVQPVSYTHLTRVHGIAAISILRAALISNIIRNPQVCL